MTEEDAWRRGARDASVRSPLQGGEPAGHADDRGGREERHIRVGVGQPSGDPAQHRAFEVRAAYRAAAGGWVAEVREEDRNEQLAGRGAPPAGAAPARAFPTAAACLGDAVRALVEAVDAEGCPR